MSTGRPEGSGRPVLMSGTTRHNHDHGSTRPSPENERRRVLQRMFVTFGVPAALVVGAAGLAAGGIGAFVVQPGASRTRPRRQTATGP